MSENSENSVMSFNEYQEATRSTAVYPHEDAIVYLGLGLASEVGEVVGKVKKAVRGDYDLSQIEDALIGEVGDCLWYIARLADELGIDLESLAVANIVKLMSRKERGAIRGNGDNR